jgi:phage I-like protein
MRVKLFALANERSALVALSNEFVSAADGWVRLAPYGLHPLQRAVRQDGRTVVQQFMQDLSRDAAETMARTHNSVFGKIRNLRRGAPIYRGHADRWDVAKQEGVSLAARQPAALANEKLGMFAELDARDDGLYGLPVFADEARAAIENEGLKYFSPFWWTDLVEVKDGVTIVRPSEFISAALTAQPNISGGHALANENDQLNEPMKKKLLELLRKYGFALANEEDATIEGALTQLDATLGQRSALENERNTLTTSITTLTTERDTARTDLAAERNALTTERAALANERTGHAGALIDLAITEGRIAASDRATRLAAFAQNFESARTALANEKPKFRITSVVDGTRKEHATTTAPHPSQKLVALANEALDKKQYGTFEDAYAAVKANNPAIVEEMKAANEAAKTK